MIYLLDTNIISEPAKPRANLLVVNKVNTSQKLCAISSITWFEVLDGMYKMPNGIRKETMRSYIFNTIAHSYFIAPFDSRCAEILAEIFAQLRPAGKTPPYRDAQIASIAIANALTLVTRNTKDFENITQVAPLRMENWFEM